MISRRALSWVLAGVAVIGLLFATLPFINSLQPSERSRALAIVLDVKDLARGSWRTVEGRRSRLYVVRTAGDVFHIFAVPTKGREVAMPDIEWWCSPIYLCRDFSPDPTPLGLSEATTIRCHDADVPAWWAPRWVWRLDGQHVATPDGGHLGDLPFVKFDRTGEIIAVYRWQ